MQWTGFVSDADSVGSWPARAFLAPSYEEGWGISIAEAMATGLPVVAYRLPILDEVYGDPYTGVPLGSVPALADALTQFLLDGEAAARAARSRRARSPRAAAARAAPAGRSCPWDSGRSRSGLAHRPRVGQVVTPGQ